MKESALNYLILLGACISLIGLGLSGVLVSRAQSENERRGKRLASILAPHLRTTQVELSAFTVVEDSNSSTWPGRLASLFGFSFNDFS